MTLFDRLVMLIWLLNAYDAAITAYATSTFEIIELNPLMNMCLATGVWFFVIVKLGVMTGVCVAFRRFARRGRRLWAGLGVVLTIFALVCVWNTWLVLRLMML